LFYQFDLHLEKREPTTPNSTPHSGKKNGKHLKFTFLEQVQNSPDFQQKSKEHNVGK